MDSFQQTHQQNGQYNLQSVTNPPPQFFGSNGAHLSPVLPNFDFNESQEAYDHDGGHDENDPKRRRIARVCTDSDELLSLVLIHPEGLRHVPQEKDKTECIFTHVEKKRNPPKGAKYIEGLENRLGRMETLLKLSGLLGGDDDDRTDLGTLEKRLADKSRSNRGTPSKESARSSKSGSLPRTVQSPQKTPQIEKIPTPTYSPPEEPGKEKEEAVEELSDMMCSLVTNNCGETRYIGSSSGFSIFSPKGIQWVNEKTGDTSFQDMIASADVNDIKWAYWKPEVFEDMFARRTFVPLPPRDEALSLLKDFFENFNCMFPLFHEPTFMHLVNRNYSRNPYEGSGWWASLNVSLAIAHRLRVMSNLVPQEEDAKAWGFLKNAMGVLTELTMRNTDLLSVQALIGMALFLLGTPNPQPSFFLVAAAIRLANSIGLHKRGSGFNLNPVEIEQRKRVFWIAYLLDKDICLRSGRPPAQDDDDMNVELPTEDPVDNIGNIPLADGKGKANLFRFMCTFAIIEAKVYKQLYSTKASRQSDGALLNTIGELDKELEEWKDAIPLDIRPEHEIKASHTPLVLHVVVLHFAYYNVLTTIHRMSVHHGYWTSRLSNYAIQGLNARPLNPRVFSSAALCVQAARASIQLIRYIPQGDYSCVWLILYFPVSALVTLFANILQNPQDPRARSDVKLMNQVVNFLSLLAVTEEQGGVKRMLGVCAEFERIARVVLERSDKESHSRRKRRSSKVNETDVSQTTRQAPQNRPAASPTPQSNGSNNAPTPQNLFTPAFSGDLSAAANQPFNPDLPNLSSPSMSNLDFQLDFSGADFNPAMMSSSTPANGVNSASMPNGDEMSAQQQFSNGDGAFNMGSFQQPFVPQDLWQMPMTLEWDWANMGNGFPGGLDAIGGSGQGGDANGQGGL
ncbi:hypothetical protein ACLMJK_008883 [Lecanora helva]